MSHVVVTGKYHGFKVTAQANDETREVLFTEFLNDEGKAMPKNAGLVGKTFPNARQAGRAAFDAITDSEKLPRLPDERFMTLRSENGVVSTKAPKAPKAEKAPKAAKSEKVAKNDAAAKKTKADRKAGPVKVTKAAKEAKPAKAPKSSKAAKSSDSDDLDF